MKTVQVTKYFRKRIIDLNIFKMLVELGAVGMFGPLMAFGSLATLFGENDDEPDRRRNRKRQT